ncbi:MAG: biopolymer transporter ExbD [Bacteroidetes bacterium]|nr:biopolymer transporter ExbD [Bacteroidota bacterium]
MARMSPEINAGSMADIAFLLLIFFLVTTTMDIDSGILRVLPPPIDPNAPPPPPVKERNVLVVLVDQFDRLMVKGQIEDVKNLRSRTKEFITNPSNDSKMPEKRMEYIEHMGDIEVSRAVISLQNDKNTSYEMYITVQNELAAAINDLRDELSRQKFGVPFSELKSEEFNKAVRQAVPMAISEAEPKDVGGKK